MELSACSNQLPLSPPILSSAARKKETFFPTGTPREVNTYVRLIFIFIEDSLELKLI
jgi:hypothetical protein